MKNRFKYPRTYHVPWSRGTSDDKSLKTMDHFHGKRVIVTEKMDGENTSIYCNAIHARSLDSADHPSRTWVKQLQGNISHLIPNGWRICGENLFAKHSIHYNNLKSYFYCFSIWNEDNFCLNWEDTEDFSELLGLETVPVLYDGIYDEKLIKSLWNKDNYDTMEGYVIRVFDSFDYSEFILNVAKFVRPKHVQTSEHWMHSEMIKNELGE